MQTHKTTAVSATGAVNGLTKLIKETDKLLKDRKLLPDIRIWHARCRGRLRRLFPDRPEIEQYWVDIELKWRVFYQGSIVDETFYDTLDQSGQGTYGEEIDRYYYYCSDSLIFLRETLLSFITLAEAGDITSSKVLDALPDPKRTSPDIGFINDSTIKVLCRQYMNGAMTSRDAKAFMPALVQIGAALEGIFYGFAVQFSDIALSATRAQKKKTNGKVAIHSEDKAPIVEPLEKWTLDAFLEVADELGWISEDGGKRLGVLVRDYRNFIHPGKLLTSNIIPDGALVDASWAGLEKVIGELQEWIRQHQDEPA